MTKIDLVLKYLGLALKQLEDPTLHDNFQSELAAIKSRPPKPRLAPISFDLIEGRFTIPSEYLKIWAEAYPAVDIKVEVAAAAAWLVANPKKAPRSSYSRFLNGWLSRTQQRGGTRGSAQTQPDEERRAAAWAKTL